MLKVLLAVALGVSSLAGVAQAEVKAHINMEESFWSDPNLTVDGKHFEFNALTGYKGLTEAMASNPQAAAYAEKYQNSLFWGNTFLFGGLATAIIYAMATASDDEFNSGTYWAIFLGGFIPGVYNLKYSQVYLYKAINTYNGINGKTSRSNQQNAPLGLALKFHF